LGLRHTTTDRYQRLLARLLSEMLDIAHAAKLGIDLLSSLITNMTGVQNNDVGVGDFLCNCIARRCEHFRHPGGVVSIHLTAVGFDKSLLGLGHVRQLPPIRLSAAGIRSNLACLNRSLQRSPACVKICCAAIRMPTKRSISKA